MASIPKYLDTRDLSLGADDDLLARVDSLLGSASSRQVWLMFLDSNDCQLPTLMPAYVPEVPEPDDGEWLEHMLGAITRDTDVATVVTIFERPGAMDLTSSDCSWLRQLSAASAEAGIARRGPFLCHNGGVRWVLADEFAI